MAATDYSVDAIKAAIRSVVPGVDDEKAGRLATVSRAIVAAEIGEPNVDATWDPDVPAAVIVESCVRVAAFLYQSRGKLGSRLIAEASVAGNPVKSSGARGLLMPWRTPRLVTEA